MEKEKIVVGLCKPQYQLSASSVDEYIFDDGANTVDVSMDFSFVENTIDRFLRDRVGVLPTLGSGVNQRNRSSTQIFAGKRDLVVYTSGSRPASLVGQLVASCASNGVNLTLMHFDRHKCEFVPQIFTFSN